MPYFSPPFSRTSLPLASVRPIVHVLRAMRSVQYVVNRSLYNTFRYAIFLYVLTLLGSSFKLRYLAFFEKIPINA